jgi:hypothetical protein
MEYKSLSFRETSVNDITPRIQSSKYNEHYSIGRLVSLRMAKDVLLIGMRYTPTEKGKQSSSSTAWTVSQAEVEFVLRRHDGWYIGGIAGQAPADFCWWSGPSASAGEKLHYIRRVDAPENEHFRPRHMIPFSVRRKGAPAGIDPDCHLNLYLQPATLGGWKEVIVLPSWADTAYVARP